MEYFLYVLLGIALAASCGFRVFVPFLVASIATYSGHLELAQDFAWLATLPAVIIFSLATILEIVAYYTPWLDNLLDTIATPAAIIAGILITASFIADMSPVLRWSTAVIAGGGSAGLIQGATVALRGTSSATTGGAGNSIVATAETGGSIIVSVLSVIVPIAGFVLVVILLFMLIRLVFKWRRRQKHIDPR